MSRNSGLFTVAFVFFFSSRRRHTRCALVTGVQTCALPIYIPVLLPEVPDAADACVGRLVSTLSAKPGVERAHVLPADGDTPAKLCIHFDGAALPLPRVREMVQAAGADISGRYGHATWQVEGIGHERRARTVGETLCQMPEIGRADASASGSVQIGRA